MEYYRVLCSRPVEIYHSHYSNLGCAWIIRMENNMKSQCEVNILADSVYKSTKASTSVTIHPVLNSPSTPVVLAFQLRAVQIRSDKI
jgi:hypothetical protein